MSAFNPNSPSTFSCQRCSQALKLDTSFHHLSSQEVQELTSPLIHISETNSKIPPSVNQSFCVDAENHAAPIGSKSPRLPEGIRMTHDKVVFAGKIFDCISGLSEIRHPLCVECTECLLEEFDRCLYESRKERDEYQDYLNFHTSKFSGVQSSEGHLEDRLRQLLEEEENLKAQMEKMLEEEEKLSKELEQLEKEEKCLQVEENSFWKHNNELNRQFIEIEQEKRCLDAKTQSLNQQLLLLKRTNIYDDTFHIWYDGSFGTINGFRLGKLPQVNVEWSEINAAWGHVCLLLYCMTERLELNLKRFRLLPLGSFSKIRRLTDNTLLELYGSGGLRFFWRAQFDQAMIGFLDCTRQLSDSITSRESHFRPPYFISRDRIGDSKHTVSIRYQSNAEEAWTKALKYMLTNIKWCLAWLSQSGS